MRRYCSLQKGKQIELLKGLPPLRFSLFFRKAIFCLRAFERKGFFTSVYGAFLLFSRNGGGGVEKGTRRGILFFSILLPRPLGILGIRRHGGKGEKDGGGG